MQICYTKYIMKYINLTKGYQAIVDDDDFLSLNQYKWHTLEQPKATYTALYACRKDYTNDSKKPIFVRMHRLILNAPKNFQVDHINGNTLDNRRSNLRLCTNQQNQFNCYAKNNRTGYKGVSWLPTIRGSKHYRSQVMVNGKYVYLGYFKTALEAAKAYDAKAKELYGKFAKTNF